MNKSKLRCKAFFMAALVAVSMLLAGCPDATEGASPSWHIETVDSSDSCGQFLSLALDSSDYPHLSYMYWDATNENVKYAHWTGSAWDGLADPTGIDTVDDSGSKVGWYTSIAVDSNDRPCISYYSQGNTDLKFVHWTGSAWDGLDGAAGADTVDNGQSAGQYTSIALDSNDYPHISYFLCTVVYPPEGELRYAHWTGSAWDGLASPAGVDTVDATVTAVGQHTSIAIDSNDYPHISYYDATNGDLKYVHWTGSAWDGLDGTAGADTVYDGQYAGQHTSIALDSNDYPHISFYGGSDLDLKYIHWTGSAWDGLDGSAGADVLDSTGQGGQYTSIALDSNGYPHISYYDVSNQDLKYVYWTGSAWTAPEAVDTEGMVGRHTSLALDSSGYPHIGYYDVDNECVKYARYGY